ncbi:MAG: hypothetical protein HN742_14910 [Lentisphaerae bacterium]|jgi:vacuolar-type H+-ATPase subunit F/Vma7|nr:hypothetical protein [Lentisphaerota bacterium]MBT5609553.1 hypothetical protein [Lentisphaerota bacterium]MBT7058459.1 hypothetical protein [Lentisphaerota bacterium]MBT7843168.1 hypothetical protein [Lentisphaerota bacterium]
MSFHIIGDEDTVVGFRFAGVTGSAVENADEAREAFQRVVGEGACSILVLTEQVESFLEREATEHRLAASSPYLVVVKDIWGTRTQRKSLESLVHEAVGIKIIQSDDE